MKGIETAFIARLGGDPEEILSAKGVTWCSFSARGRWRTDDLGASAFGDVAQRIAAELRKGCQAVEGALRLSQWQDKRTGETRHGLEVAAWRCEPLGLIGERRPKKAQGRARRRPGTARGHLQRPIQRRIREREPTAFPGRAGCCAGNERIFNG
jgi:single-stranded DNA-binding protein